MKEIIRKKMDEHIDRILAKDEITNEDYYLLNMVCQKIEGEEALAEMKAKNEEEREKDKQRQKEMYENLLRTFCPTE